MFPSSSRIKLNRVTLKEVIGLRLGPRRRRVPKQKNILVDSTKEEGGLVSEPPRTLQTSHRVPENGAGTTKLEDSHVDFSRNTHLDPTGRAGSEGCLRRSIGASYCGVCRETKYSSSHRRNLGKQRPKSSSLRSEPPATEVKVKTENGEVETSDIYLWINQYPKVILCDIAKKCNACGHDCGYVLSDVVKTKTVRCFKQDMGAGFHFWPSCLGNNTHEKQERGLGKTDKCSSTHNKMKRCKHQHHKHLEAGASSQPPSSSTTQRFHDSRESKDSAARSASVLIGKHAHKWDFRTDVGGRNSEAAARPRSENHRDKRIKLAERLGCSSPLTESCVAKKPGDQRGDAAETNATLTSSEPSDDVDAAEPKSFTCQRVKPYVRKMSYSCARTNVSWPFLKGYQTREAHDASSGSSERVTMNQIQARSSSKQIKDILPDEPLEKQEEDAVRISAEKNGKDHSNICCNSDRRNVKGTARAEQSEESSIRSDAVSFSISGRGGRKRSLDLVSTSPFTCNGPEIDSSISTPSPSALGLSDYETTTAFSPVPEPNRKGVSRSFSNMPPSHPPSSFLPKEVKGVELKAVDKHLFSEETQLFSCSPLSSVSPHISSSFPQGDHQNEFIPQRTPPRYNSDPSPECPVLSNVNDEQHVPLDWNEFILPPVLSPVASPRHLWWRSPSCQSSSSSEEIEQEERNREASRREASPECHMPQIVKGCSGCHEHSSEEMERVSTDLKTSTDSTPVTSQSSPSSDEDACDCEEEESLAKSADAVEHGRRSAENNLLDPEVKASPASSVPAEARSCPSSGRDDGAAFSDDAEQDSVEDEKGPAKMAGRENDETKAQPSFFDEFMAYEQDILLVDVMQDDPELFENLPEQSLLRLGPARVAEAPKRKPAAVVKMLSSNGTSVESEQRLPLVNTTFHCNSPDITEDGDSRPWRPRSSTTPTTIQISFPATNKEARHVQVQFDANNNHVDGGLERSQPIQMLSSTHSTHPLVSTGNGPRIKNSAVVTDFRRQKSNAYCRLYFSETLSCGFKMCRFLHLPVEGDEKFCVDTVARFSKNLACLQKAGAVFTGYYHNNPAGVYFSMPVFLCLLWALLKAGMVSEIFSVLGVSLAHNIVPGHEFLLALFNYVREKGLMGFVPELMQLTFKMASVGLELSLDCLDCVKNVPAFQQTDPNSMSSNHKLSTSASSPEYLNLAHAIVEIELCTKQEDWKRAGEVYKSICQSSYHPTQVERISGRITIALLSESKDKLVLPFSAFAETVCQNEGEDSLIKSFVGRIGVSLMLRYHKTHQWVKGRKVVETMSMSRVNYTTLKGLFGNEDGASCCHLVTVATELFILSGSVEGALNTLRENKWFLSSCSWPCEPADLENRTRVLMCLAEKTSHRDTLDVLCNLPGIKEPNDIIDISRYTPLFNSHLQLCLERQILPVAADTVDLMLSKDLAVDHSVLQALLQKLGKQNLWLRAREVFKHSLRAGYYAGVSAPAGFMALIVPCGLGEVEMALTFEMFLTVNASSILALPETATTTLSITLKRTESCESSYLTAGSLLLSAACIPQPKLIIHYTAVNSTQEQVFRLDVSSARRWLRHNHLWANEIWAH